MKLYAILTALCALALVGLAACTDADDAPGRSPQGETVEVRRAPFRVVVREGGTLESANSIVIRNEAYGKRPIIELVAEGSYVEVGQVVCRLESQDLEEAEIKYQRRADSAASAFRQAEQHHAIQQKRNLEQIGKAEATLALAMQAYSAYVNGTLPLERKRLASELTIAREERERAKTTHEASQRLFDRDILPKARLQADALGAKKAMERMAIAEESLIHFEEFVHKDELKKLQAACDVADITLQRVQQQCNSELAQALDALDTCRKNLDDQLEILGKVQRHVANCTVRSPAEGLIVYARRRGRDKEYPISLGRWMRQREPLLIIPSLDEMTVQLDIHESQVENVVKGLPATVTIDAFPKTSVPGTVDYVAPVPSTTSSWMNPDYKIYQTDITLAHTVNGARPGMHCEVSILISDEQDVLQVPIVSVLQSGPRSFVCIPTGEMVELREIEVGAINETAAEVMSGLTEGERIFLEPPASAPAPPEAASRPFLPATEDDEFLR